MLLMSKNKKTFSAVIAIIAVAASLTGVAITEQVPKANAQVPVDAMTTITNQIVNNLSTGINAEVQRENINQAESLVYGKPVIFPTNGVPDTVIISQEYDFMVEELNQGLLQCAEGTCSDPEVAAQAKELFDRNVYWQEIKQVLETQTTEPTCDANDPTTCVLLDQGDEPQATGNGINVGTDKIWDGWYREVRSPYVTQTFYPFGFTPEENVITIDAIGDKECVSIVKEIQGQKSILRPVKIPIWQEPWTSRATIIGFDTVWVVDFIPAEFVKNLNYCNKKGEIVFDYEINVIIERELTHFWKYLPAGKATP